MKYALLLTLLYPALLCAQPFQQETNTIPVEIYGWQPFSPFTKGYTATTPELCDIDGDGDLDFFLGNGYPQVSYFVNNGSLENADFEWQTDDYSPFETINMTGRSSSEFCDMDSDGDPDAIISGGYALSRYYENIGTAAYPQLILAIDTLKCANGTLIWGEHLSMVDIDADGLFELFADRYFGILTYYENIGTPDSFSFQMAEYQFEGLDTGSMPKSHFLDIDDDGDYDLLVGNQEGTIYYFQNLGDSANWDFQLVTTEFNGIDVSRNATPTTAQIDDDGDFDLFSGRDPYDPSAPEQRGDIFYWENQGTPQEAAFQYITSEYLTLDEGYFEVGDFADIDGDGDTDMLLASGTDISFYKNVGTVSNPSFVLQTEHFAALSLGGMGPIFSDLDGDGDLDLANSEGSFTYARVKFYQNVGTPQSPSFQEWFEVNQPGALAENHTLADIDNDGDADLFFTDGYSDFYFFENIGTPNAPAYEFIEQNFQGISNYDGYPTFQDWDGDGDLDLFLWGNGQNFNYFENVGSAANPQFTLSAIDYFGENYGLKVSFVDIDADGDQDAFFTSNPGGVVFLRNLAISSVPPLPRTAPYRGPVLEVGPNPANPVTTFSFELRAASCVSLAVYDVSGRKVAALLSGRQEAGTHVVTWDASGLGSGVYLARLTMSGYQNAQKIVVVK